MPPDDVESFPPTGLNSPHELWTAADVWNCKSLCKLSPSIGIPILICGFAARAGAAKNYINSRINLGTVVEWISPVSSNTQGVNYGSPESHERVWEPSNWEDLQSCDRSIHYALFKDLDEKLPLCLECFVLEVVIKVRKEGLLLCIWQEIPLLLWKEGGVTPFESFSQQILAHHLALIQKISELHQMWCCILTFVFLAWFINLKENWQFQLGTKLFWDLHLDEYYFLLVFHLGHSFLFCSGVHCRNSYGYRNFCQRASSDLRNGL